MTRTFFEISELIDSFIDDIERILEVLIQELPRAFRYPEFVHVLIRLEGRIKRSPDFKETTRCLKSPVISPGEDFGSLQICYDEELSIDSREPFLEEEKLFLKDLARRLGRLAERARLINKIEMGEMSIRDKDTAIKEILDHSRVERRELSERFLHNIDTLILPLIESLSTDLKETQHEEKVALLRKNLEEIAAPFSSKLAAQFKSLSSKELQVCSMVRIGLGTKDIAAMLHLSTSTIERHRENIRRKLQLTGKKMNLARYLQEYMKEWTED